MIWINSIRRVLMWEYNIGRVPNRIWMKTINSVRYTTMIRFECEMNHSIILYLCIESDFFSRLTFDQCQESITVNKSSMDYVHNSNVYYWKFSTNNRSFVFVHSNFDEPCLWSHELKGHYFNSVSPLTDNDLLRIQVILITYYRI